MAMRLLSQPQGRSQRELDNSAQELRSVELDGLIQKKRKELNDLDLRTLAYTSETLNTQVTQENVLKERIRLLKEEVSNLEKRKAQALVPLDLLEKEVNLRVEALAKREESVSIKETDITQTVEFLTDRIDEVSEREANALSYAVELEARNSNISLKENEQKKREEAVLAVMQQVTEQRLLDESQIAKQKAILKGRATVLEERENAVARQEAGFANRERAIIDRYQTLERAIAEMKLRYGSNLII